MPTPITARLSVYFADKEGNERALSFLFPSSVTPQSCFAWLNGMLPVLNAISNAVVTRAKWEYRVIEEYDLLEAPDVDARSFLALYYRNETRIEAIYIPAPKIEAFETEGPYANVRADALYPPIVTFNQVIANSDPPIVDERGALYPTIFLVGGLLL